MYLYWKEHVFAVYGVCSAIGSKPEFSVTLGRSVSPADGPMMEEFAGVKPSFSGLSGGGSVCRATHDSGETDTALESKRQPERAAAY